MKTKKRKWKKWTKYLQRNENIEWLYAKKQKTKIRFVLTKRIEEKKICCYVCFIFYCFFSLYFALVFFFLFLFCILCALRANVSNSKLCMWIRLLFKESRIIHSLLHRKPKMEMMKKIFSRLPQNFELRINRSE